MDNIYEFFAAALPWVCMGLFLTIFIVSKNKKKKDDKTKEDYSSEGLALGMCFGVAIGTSFGNISIGISLGMLIGLAIGSCVEKKWQRMDIRILLFQQCYNNWVGEITWKEK